MVKAESILKVVGFKTRAKGNTQLLLDCRWFWEGVTLGTCKRCKYHSGFVLGGARCMRATLEDNDETN